MVELSAENAAKAGSPQRELVGGSGGGREAKLYGVSDAAGGEIGDGLRKLQGRRVGWTRAGTAKQKHPCRPGTGAEKHPAGERTQGSQRTQ
jgi:hypothetical protein